MVNTLFLLIGIIIGFFIKVFFDKYHDFKNEERRRADELEDLLAHFKALDMIKQQKDESSLS